MRRAYIFGYDRINSDGSYHPKLGSDGLLGIVDRRKSISTIRHEAEKLCKSRSYIAYSIGYLSPSDDGKDKIIQDITPVNEEVIKWAA